MASKGMAFDVYVSHTRRDSALVSEIAAVLRSHDLRVLTDTEIAVGTKIEQALWEAIAECQAFVVIVPESESSAWAAFELGAARAWNKPIYAIAANPATARLPIGLEGVSFYSPSRADEIAEEIRRASESLTPAEINVLIEQYQSIGVTVDQLMLSPKRLSRLASQFKRRTKRQVAPEELVRMLLRLRKQRSLGPVAGTRKKRGT